VDRVANNQQHLHAEPANMPSKQPTTNAQLPDRLYGEHYPDSFLDMPRPVRESSVATLGDYIRHLQEVSNQSDKSCVSSESNESKFQHICPNNPILTCNCSDPNACAELGSDPDNRNEDRCPDHDGFSDNLDYTGIPYPNTQGKDAVSGWPCVVIGAIPETGFSAAEHVLRTTASEWNTKQHTDAGLNNDGPVATKGL
jgi:hypothetical protein